MYICAIYKSIREKISIKLKFPRKQTSKFLTYTSCDPNKHHLFKSDYTRTTIVTKDPQPQNRESTNQQRDETTLDPRHLTMEQRVKSKLIEIYSQAVRYQRNKNVNEFYFNLIRLYCDLKAKKLNISMCIIENFDFYFEGKNLNKIKFNFLVKSKTQSSKLGLKPYEKVFQMMRDIMMDFKVMFVLFSTYRFFKSRLCIWADTGLRKVTRWGVAGYQRGIWQ